jgi:histidine triad (HIT) family protein
MTNLDCIFCSIVSGAVPAHVVAEDDAVVAFLDTRPLFVGHTLVIPRDHFETLADLPPEMIEPYFAGVQRLALAVQEAMAAAGSFVALNNTVSQSVPHLHTHVVPRNRKDGLRGFFWPRTSYTDDSHAAATASQIAAVL